MGTTGGGRPRRCSTGVFSVPLREKGVPSRVKMSGRRIHTSGLGHLITGVPLYSRYFPSVPRGLVGRPPSRNGDGSQPGPDPGGVPVPVIRKDSERDLYFIYL